MTINKLAIIGGSGLYDVEEFKERELISLSIPLGENHLMKYLKPNTMTMKYIFSQDMEEVILFHQQK